MDSVTLSTSRTYYQAEDALERINSGAFPCSRKVQALVATLFAYYLAKNPIYAFATLAGFTLTIKIAHFLSKSQDADKIAFAYKSLIKSLMQSFDPIIMKEKEIQKTKKEQAEILENLKRLDKEISQCEEKLKKIKERQDGFIEDIKTNNKQLPPDKQTTGTTRGGEAESRKG